MTQPRNKVGTSFRLSPAARDLIEQIADKLGVSQASVVEMAVRKLGETEGLMARQTERAPEHEQEGQNNGRQ